MKRKLTLKSALEVRYEDSNARMQAVDEEDITQMLEDHGKEAKTNDMQEDPAHSFQSWMRSQSGRN